MELHWKNFKNSPKTSCRVLVGYLSEVGKGVLQQMQRIDLEFGPKGANSSPILYILETLALKQVPCLH